MELTRLYSLSSSILKKVQDAQLSEHLYELYLVGLEVSKVELGEKSISKNGAERNLEREYDEACSNIEVILNDHLYVPKDAYEDYLCEKLDWSPILVTYFKERFYSYSGVTPHGKNFLSFAWDPSESNSHAKEIAQLLKRIETVSEACQMIEVEPHEVLESEGEFVFYAPRSSADLGYVRKELEVIQHGLESMSELATKSYDDVRLTLTEKGSLMAIFTMTAVAIGGVAITMKKILDAANSWRDFQLKSHQLKELKSNQVSKLDNQTAVAKLENQLNTELPEIIDSSFLKDRNFTEYSDEELRCLFIDSFASNKLESVVDAIFSEVESKVSSERQNELKFKVRHFVKWSIDRLTTGARMSTRLLSNDARIEEKELLIKRIEPTLYPKNLPYKDKQ